MGNELASDISGSVALDLSFEDEASVLQDYHVVRLHNLDFGFVDEPSLLLLGELLLEEFKSS